MLEQLENPGKK